MAQHPSIALGVAAALGATVLVSSGLVLQALDARGIERHHGLRLSLLGRLLRQRRWLAGTAIIYLAFPLQLLALAHAPLVVVAPVHAGGLLLVLAAGVRLLRERIGRFELLGVLAIVAGIAILAWGAPAGRDHEISQSLYAGVTAGLLALLFVPFVRRARCGRLVLLVCTGIGFAAVNVAVKGFSDHLASQHYAAAAGYLGAAAVASTAGLMAQASAFQRHPAVEVVPVIYAITNFLPVVLGLAILQEHWSGAALAGIPFAVGGLVLLAGTAAVARARPVVAMVRRATAVPPPV